jgi:hypothetical protein
MRWRVQYPLSSLFLLTLACAIALGWYVDSRNRRTLVGTWEYPTPDSCVLGYGSTLEIRADGTFTKVQTHRDGCDTFEGTYTVGKDSRVIFHVTSKTIATDLRRALHQEPDRIKVDASYECRCATDAAGYLVLSVNTWAFPENDNVGIQWETCVRRAAYGVKGP